MTTEEILRPMTAEERHEVRSRPMIAEEIRSIATTAAHPFRAMDLENPNIVQELLERIGTLMLKRYGKHKVRCEFDSVSSVLVLTSPFLWSLSNGDTSTAQITVAIRLW